MEYLSNFLPNLEHLGVWGYWVVFAFALLESLAFVGTLVPGTIFIVLAGFLSARGLFDFKDLFILTTLGAILGDSISYYLGTRGTMFFTKKNKIFKLSHLDQGKEFFEKHGNKSIFLGRFVGVIRPIMPFVAGLSEMKIRKFLFWDVLSGLLWAAFHLALGYFFGGSLSLIETWTDRIGYFIFILLLILTLIWLIVWKGRPLINFIKSILISAFTAIATNDNVRDIVARYPKTFFYLRDRFNTNKFSGLSLTMVAILFVYAFFLFVGAVENIVVSNQLVQADMSITNFLIGFRNIQLIKIFTWITMLGKGTIIASLGIATALILVLWQRTKFIFPLVAVLASSGLLTYLSKIGFHRPRPWQAIYAEKYFSFPSAHTALATALYGFLAYLIFRNFKKLSIKLNAIFFAAAIIFLVSFSRLYLGVHYLSDVWGGFLVGVMCLLVGITIAEWEVKKGNSRLADFVEKIFTVYHKKVITYAIVLIEIIFFITLASVYSPILNVALPPNTIRVNQEKIIEYFSEKKIPRYTESLIGNQQEPLNFIFVAKSEDEIKQAFAAAGWSLADKTTPSSFLQIVKAVILNKEYKTAPMTISFWNNEPNIFGFEKSTNANTARQRHHIRFWQTNIMTAEEKKIFVATASFDAGIKWPLIHRINPDIDTERDYVFTDLVDADRVSITQKIDFVSPVLGQNFGGDPFFTNGQLYEIVLK